MHVKKLALLAIPVLLAACESLDQSPEVSIQAKDGNVNVNSSGLEKATDSTLKGPASINISKDGNVSVNGQNVGVNVDSGGLNVKMKDGKGVQIDSGKIKVNIGGIKVDIQK